MKVKSQNNDLTARIMGQMTPPSSTAPQVAETMMFTIAIDQIDEYEGNPRLYENPEFKAIKGINPRAWRRDSTYCRNKTS